LVTADLVDRARASEAAAILDCTEESVTSALKRARHALRYQRAQADGLKPPPPDSAAERDLVRRFTQAYEAGDVDAVVALLTQDAWLIMPPIPLRYQGREVAARFLTATACPQFGEDRREPFIAAFSFMAVGCRLRGCR
jgi:hypothetical protein